MRRHPTCEVRTERHLSERAPFDVEYPLITRAGEYRWFHGRGLAIRNAAGYALRMEGSIGDIHEPKCTEPRSCRCGQRDRELREREAFAQHLLLSRSGNASALPTSCTGAWVRTFRC